MKYNDSIVLGIETSCDDTSMAIIKQSEKKPQVLSHISFGQEESLAKWGGVVPEIAARNHLEKIPELIKATLEKAQIEADQIDLIGVTALPGLLGPLLTGLNAAKTLSLLYKKPILPVNHLYAHLEAVHIDQNVTYPYLGLLVSGGHGLFAWVTSPSKFQIIGSTIDDAPGEAFDKGAKLLGLGYPGGHLIDRLACFGEANAYDFPIGLRSSADCRLSYSGLKTSLRVLLEKETLETPLQFNQQDKRYQKFYNICASYQKAIIDALELKTRYAIKKCQEDFKIKNFPLVIGGGVANNSGLRFLMQKKFNQVYFVSKEFCSDNGAMIANYALRNQEQAIAYPQCLELDARGRFISKKDFI